MSDERREVAWRKWWGDRGFNPAHHLAFNEGWDARNDEVEALKAALRKARGALSGSLKATTWSSLNQQPISRATCDICGNPFYHPACTSSHGVSERAGKALAEIDAVLDEK